MGIQDLLVREGEPILGRGKELVPIPLVALVEGGLPVRLTEPGEWFAVRSMYAEDPDGTLIELVDRSASTGG